MSKNQQIHDLSDLINQSKSQHSILDKSTGQVLGYALMTTDQSVSVDQLKFVSIPWPEGGQQPQDAGPGGAQLLLPPHCPSPGPESMQVNLMSDLDLSQGSSMNETLEEDQPSYEVKNPVNLLQTKPSDQNGNNYETSPDSPMSQTSIYSSISPSPTATNLTKTPDHQTRLIQPAVKNSSSSTKVNLDPLVSSPKQLPTLSSSAKPVASPSSSVTVKQEFPNKVESLARSLASDIIAAKLKKENDLAKPSYVSSVKESLVLNGKRKFVENFDENCKEKKIKVEVQLQRATKADFDPFIELVDEGKDKKYQRVKCLMCGKLLSLGNFSRHIRAIHEPHIMCDNCGKEFSGEQLKVHMKKCVWQNLDFVEKTGKFEVSESKVVLEDAIPVPLPVTNQVHVAFPESPVNTSTSSVSTCATENSSGISVKSNDDVPTNGERHPSSASFEVSQPSTSEGGDWVSLVLTSASVEGVRTKMKIQKGTKVKKAMRSFGKRHNIEGRKNLRFLLGSRELTGEEKVEELDGSEIDVFGEIVPMKI